MLSSDRGPGPRPADLTLILGRGPAPSRAPGGRLAGRRGAVGPRGCRRGRP
ncbi:MAG: hypothetical protein AVDCRST_MAG57-340 [uncultured Blastococcus sp.]|uniref:Uncharacterized protein n=1 Tax=uncultured Blastococcus sp. TaxID=217144 RepID=A0A6J4H9M4_9ACTN|nr:MAG: hypothetical protein AVDCRST_MAG57-340 [uncultured Blastococcus sp.]